MQRGVGDVFSAAVLFVAQDNRCRFHRAYGWLSPEIPAQKESLFDLASLTKLFTATAFLTLVDAGKVALDTPLQTVLPLFGGLRPVTASLDPLTHHLVPPDAEDAGRMVDAGSVTFRHLLTHTAGLPPVADFCKNVDPENLPRALPRALLDDFIQSVTFAALPGRKVMYSDVGFILLGEAVSRLAGMPLWTYLQKAVLTPLGLGSVIINPRRRGLSAVPTENCAWRRRRCRGEVHDENAACLGGFAGHAGLFAAAKDVATLGQLYLNEGLVRDIRILSVDTARRATRPQAAFGGIRRGLGWALPDEDGNSPVGIVPKETYGHTGFTGTSLWIDPRRRLVVALLTNRVYYGRDIEKIRAFRARLHAAIWQTWSAQ